ncbi:MAG: PIN domain-containing protein [Caldisericia bacterium]|jgi:rRNA-processing protein FCF1
MPIHSSLNLVIDSNIWIYLADCSLIGAALDLGSLHAPDVMRMAEPITETTWDDLENQGAILDELTSDDVRAALEILDNNRGISFCDAACLVIAEKNAVPLVTHDKKLLNVARRRNIRTYDYDALLDLMVAKGIIESKTRQAAFETLVRIGERPK